METAGQPKRRRFQFHLSTAIAMVVVAGVWIGLNLHCVYRNGVGPEIRRLDFQVTQEVDWVRENDSLEYGLPMPFLRREGRIVGDPEPEWRFVAWSFALDLLSALALLVTTLLVSEWLLRRRERRGTTS